MEESKGSLAEESCPHRPRKQRKETLVSDQDLEKFVCESSAVWSQTPCDSFFWLATNSSGRGVFHFMVSCEDRMSIVEIEQKTSIAAKNGSQINLVDQEAGDTPLHLAVWNSANLSAKAIIACGASPFVRNSAGKTPLQLLRDINAIVVRRPEIYAKMASIERMLTSAEELGLLSDNVEGSATEGGGDGASSI